MKKIILGILTFISLWFWTLFAESILPDEAKIDVKSQIIQWEAANLSITMLKNWSKMSSYVGGIYISIVDENWKPLKANEYTLPGYWIYTFTGWDLWSVTFQKWLKIELEWTFYIEVEAEEDIWNVIWREPITVTKGTIQQWIIDIDILTPTQDITISDEKLQIMAQVPDLSNSNAIIYIDDIQVDTTLTDNDWLIQHVIKDVREWKHALRIEILDMDWSVVWASDTINFTMRPTSGDDATVIVEPETWIRVGDLVKVTANTDDMVESVKIRLSDNEHSEYILTKDANWKFSSPVLLTEAWIINISLETSSARGTNVETFDNVKQITVLGTPEITNIITWANAEEQTAELSWSVLNGDVPSYHITYWLGDEQTDIYEDETDTKSFSFTHVPYDTPLNVIVTPYRNNWTKHWAASETIRFVITKSQQQGTGQDPTNPNNTGSDLTSITIPPRCIVENISTRTTKIWENYYLIWDKVENVSKYIVYSSTLPDGSDKMKVYETSDTSYQYPFDKTSEEDKFAYFWIVWICDDGQQLELTWATKVQVWPAENFFLLICMTFLIYFWIKLFRQTEE